MTEVRTADAIGATVDEAIGLAVAELGVGREDVVVEVLAQPTQAAPGESLSTAGSAKVRVLAVDERTTRARTILVELLQAMGIDAGVNVRLASDADGAPMILDVSGDDLGLLIGWRGETLRALQTVVNLMLGDEESAELRRIIIDVERYRARRESQVMDLAKRLANRVKRTGERYTLDPMQPYERRAVHIALADDHDVRTESSGKEPARRIVIHPTGPAQPDLPEIFASRDGGSGGRPRGQWRDRR
jgi:spoIIIJ-associated protein